MAETVDQRTHVLERPSMYIGPVDKSDRTVWVLMKSPRPWSNGTFFSSALMKIVDEIGERAGQSCAQQHLQVFHNVKDPHRHRRRRLDFYRERWRRYQLQVHAATQIYTPQLVFGQLLTSSNYDDTQERITGGMNGIGSK
jgi:DNA topoisomerase-2